MCCAEDEPSKAEANTDCCPIGMCNSGQCCFCYFNCPVDNEKIEINIFEENLKIKFLSDKFALSDFTSDCWQPPKRKL